jgi:hypothetical protein
MVRFALLGALLLALVAGLSYARMLTGDGSVVGVAPPAAHERTTYIEQGLIPSSLPADATINSITRDCCGGEYRLVTFELGSPLQDEWLSQVREIPHTPRADEAGELSTARATGRTLVFGDVCEDGSAWRYHIAETGSGGALFVGTASRACTEPTEATR